MGGSVTWGFTQDLFVIFCPQLFDKTTTLKQAIQDVDPRGIGGWGWEDLIDRSITDTTGRSITVAYVILYEFLHLLYNLVDVDAIRQQSNGNIATDAGGVVLRGPREAYGWSKAQT